MDTMILNEGHPLVRTWGKGSAGGGARCVVRWLMATGELCANIRAAGSDIFDVKNCFSISCLDAKK